MKIEKTFAVNAPQEKVWAFITAPEKVAPCIPGCEGAEETGAGKYKASVRVKVGPIKTTFKVDIERTDEQAPDFASYETRGEEGSKASRIKATSTLSLKKLSDSETEVTYSSDITLMGRLGKFGSGMMQKVADSIGNEFVNALKQQLEEGTGEAAAAPEPATTGKGGRTGLYLAAGGAVLLLILLYLLLG